MTTGLATLGAALIGAVATLVAAHHDAAAPPAAAQGASTGSGRLAATSGAVAPTAPGRFVPKYTGVQFRLPHPPADQCQDPTVSFEGDGPKVETEDAGVARIDAFVDLVYENCNPEGQLWLSVPEQNHELARVDGDLDAAGCASAANLRQIDKKLPAEALQAGQYYCLRTYNGYIAEFTVLAVSAEHDVELRASAWLDRSDS